MTGQIPSKLISYNFRRFVKLQKHPQSCGRPLSRLFNQSTASPSILGPHLLERHLRRLIPVLSSFLVVSELIEAEVGDSKKSLIPTSSVWSRGSRAYLHRACVHSNPRMPLPMAACQGLPWLTTNAVYSVYRRPLRLCQTGCLRSGF